MMTSRPAIFALLAVTALSAGGCKWSRRASAPAPPSPPVSASAPAVSQPAPPAPVVLPPTPKPEPAHETAPPAPPSVPPAQVVHPPKPKSEPALAPAPAGPAPAFGQILTPQQQTELRRSYQHSAQFARQTLSQLSGRALSQDQADTANRIRSFLSQADEAQSKDPSVASQLARRAELLARDLLNSLR